MRVQFTLRLRDIYVALYHLYKQHIDIARVINTCISCHGKCVPSIFYSKHLDNAGIIVGFCGFGVG